MFLLPAAGAMGASTVACACGCGCAAAGVGEEGGEVNTEAEGM